MKVECIDNGGYRKLTEGKIYDVVSIARRHYEIKNDAGVSYEYNKIYFKEVKEENKMAKFTLDMIKDGMVVEIRNGSRWLKVSDTLISTNGNYEPLKKYNNDLTHISNDEFDITKVFKIQSTYMCLPTNLSSINNNAIIWQKKEPKEMTIAQIEEALGYTIKVIK